MKHPDKWRETADPFALPYKHFSLTEILGYPHAGNDVFHVRGRYQNKETEAYIKVARQSGADLENEIKVIRTLKHSLTPTILDFDEENYRFVVTAAKQGERLSTIVGNNTDASALEYLYEYGQTLAKFHMQIGNFADVKDRRFFHIPEESYFANLDLRYVYNYLVAYKPKTVNKCFCHGDFHYANILWKNKHIAAVLDFELSGFGNKEFDIAWALILRPGQKFLRTKEELNLFMRGYQSVGSCEIAYVMYYMVLIYSYFYKIGSDDPAYQAFIQTVFRELCTGYCP